MRTTAQRIAHMLAMKPERITIAINGVWSASFAPVVDGTTTTTSVMHSYERIDYHTGCRTFLQGLADAGVPFTICHDKNEEPTRLEGKPGQIV